LSIESGVREELEKALGLSKGALPERLWKYLTHRSLVAQYIRREISRDALVRECTAAIEFLGLERTVYGSAPMLTQQQRERAADHQTVLAILLAGEARADRELQHFRQVELNGKTLSPPELDAWLHQQGEIDKSEPVGDESWRLLVCAGPDDTPIALQARSGGTLEKLRVLAERLARQFSWNVMQATRFVLSDTVPAVPVIKLHVDYSRRWPGATRIILDIDPTASPRLVAEQFRKRRQSLFTRRLRLLGPRPLKLAAFTAERPTDEPWGVRMEAWNAHHADSRYTRVNNFKRDCLDARRRMLTLGEPGSSRRR
jgi:hypothetical protein